MPLPVHRWDTQAAFQGRRIGTMYVVVLCRHCGTMATAIAGSSPLRPGPCAGERRPAEPIRWATRRLEPTARFAWLLRGL